MAQVRTVDRTASRGLVTALLRSAACAFQAYFSVRSYMPVTSSIT